MSTVQAGGVRFRLHPQNHEPIHAHARYGETIVIVELRANGIVALAGGSTRLVKAKRGDVRKILITAAEHFDEIMQAWERMH